MFTIRKYNYVYILIVEFFWICVAFICHIHSGLICMQLSHALVFSTDPITASNKSWRCHIVDVPI